MSADTTIVANPSLSSMRKMALALLPHLKWRHHGIGVLQAYISEETEPEVRMHIWSPELLKPGITASGDVHDHRFDMVSHVLIGAVGHESFYSEESDTGDWEMSALTHARMAKDTGYHGPVKRLPERYSVRRETQ